MVRGIGVDTVDIRRIENMLEKTPPPAFLRKAFTPEELRQAPASGRVRVKAEYLAARFAAKEAVFKAIAHLLPEGNFDFLLVETLYGKNNCPFVNTEGQLKPILERADVSALHISITTEGDFATAFVVACRE